MDIPTDAQLLGAVEAFLLRHDIAPSRFGLSAMGDGALVKQMREGRSLSLRNVEKVCSFMESYAVSAAQQAAA